MKKESNEEAARLPNEQELAKIKQDPSKVCHALRVRIFCFIMDIEKLMHQPEISDTPEFLDRFSSDITTLHALSDCSSGCSISIKEAGKLIESILTCPIQIKHTNIEITTLGAAVKYRADKEYYDIFSSILKAYQYGIEETEILLNELKILAFDLNGEK